MKAEKESVSAERDIYKAECSSVTEKLQRVPAECITFYDVMERSLDNLLQYLQEKETNV